jgi:LuxR family maltose regulon positive regulatory protein
LVCQLGCIIHRNMSAPQLSTKHHIPSLRAGHVPRPHLVGILNQSSQARLVLISAPAGYGKSTLVCEWLQQSRLPVGWLSLDTNDNDFKRLVAYLVAALQAVLPGFGYLVLSLLESPQPVPGQAILTTLVNELDQRGEPVALILDDYHHITDRSIHEAIAFLIENLPTFVHLFILTRSDPPIPLARLRAQNQLVEIRADDLRFTIGETTAFLNHTMGLSLTPELVDALDRRTEGWITGLQLAAISLQGIDMGQRGDFITAFTGSHHYTVDYLVEEVLNRQPDMLRDFLLRTSILERMSGALCDALTGRLDGQVTLERLDQGDLFIVPLDAQRQWYRYHNLLADVLHTRLQQSRPELLPELHKRAAQWYQENGYPEQAISHAVAAGDIEAAAELVESNAISLLMRGELVTLLNWIEPIEEAAGDRPWLSTYKAWALTLTGQLDMAEAWLERAEDAMARPGQKKDDNLRGHIAAIRAYIAEARGEADLTICYAEQALQLLPESDQAVRSVVTFTLGTAYRLIGDQRQATRTLQSARSASHLAGNRYLELGTMFTLADLIFDQGQLHQAFDIYQQTLKLATTPGGQELPAAGMVYFGLGLIQYEWNDLEAALENTHLAIDLCRQWGHFVNLAGSLVLLSRLELAAGALDDAQHAIQQAEELNREHALALRAESWVKAFRVRLWLAQGNLGAAARWVEECGISMADDFSYLREAEYFSLGYVFLASGKYDQVLELTRWLQNAAESTGRVGSLIETFVLRALAHQATGDLHQALDSLERALTIAQPEGYIRVFVNQGKPMAELLRRAGTQGLEPHFVARLLPEIDQIFSGPPAEAQPLIEPLTKRELEVLQLLAAGLSNAEIADQFVITVGTVKAHTASIYQKLNVNRRSQAVARARELKIL